MRSLIQSYGLVDFVENWITTEEEEKLEDWKRTDELLRGWIRATIDEDLLVLVEHLETTKQVFDKLEQSLTQPFQPGIDSGKIYIHTLDFSHTCNVYPM